MDEKLGKIVFATVKLTPHTHNFFRMIAINIYLYFNCRDYIIFMFIFIWIVLSKKKRKSGTKWNRVWCKYFFSRRVSVRFVCIFRVLNEANKVQYTKIES